MKISFFKRRYYDLRLGGIMVSPMVQMGNFAMIAFLYVRDIIPLEIFAPLFMILGLVGLSIIGNKFRKHQASTDWNMVLEKQTRKAAIFYQMMKAIKEGKTDKEFDKQMEYLKSIKDDDD